MFTSAWQEVIFPLPKSCVCKSRGKQEGFRLFYTGTWGKSHWFMPHGDTCSTLTQGHMFTKWRSQWTKYNMQLCQLVKDRVKEKLETLNIFTNSGGVTGNARRSSRAWNHEHHYFESWIENHTKSQSKKKNHRLTSESVCVPDNIWAHAWWDSWWCLRGSLLKFGLWVEFASGQRMVLFVSVFYTDT